MQEMTETSAFVRYTLPSVSIGCNSPSSSNEEADLDNASGSDIDPDMNVAGESDSDCNLIEFDGASSDSESEVNDNTMSITWDDTAILSKRAAYRGTSRWTTYRSKKALSDASQGKFVLHTVNNSCIGTQKITQFFMPQENPQENHSPENDSTPLNLAISLLSDILTAKISSTCCGGLSLHDAKRYMAIQSYFAKINGGGRKIVSSQEVACEIFPRNSTVRCSRRIREWSSFYLHNLFLPPSIRGKHQKAKPLLCENDLKDQCLSFLRGSPVGTVNICMFKNFIESELLPGRTVSTSNVGKFLRTLGYKYTILKKECT